MSPKSSAPLPPIDRREVDDALRFVHVMASQAQARNAETSANLNALIEVLIAEGVLPLEAFQKRRHLTVLRENERGAADASIHIADDPDKYAAEVPQIDCASLYSLCKGRCCTMDVTLSVQDLDERVLRWSYHRPYLLERRKDGYCVHHTEEGRCGAYEQRPATCRSYDCRNDPRIWKDFAARVPAQ